MTYSQCKATVIDVKNMGQILYHLGRINFAKGLFHDQLKFCTGDLSIDFIEGSLSPIVAGFWTLYIIPES